MASIPRLFVVLALVSLIFFYLLHFTTFRQSHAFVPHHPTPLLENELGQATISLQSIIDTIVSEIDRRVAELDVVAIEADMGLQLKHTSRESYEFDLRRTFAEFFSPSSSSKGQQSDVLSQVLARLHPLGPSGIPLPKFIYTTDIRGPGELPEQFQSWAKVNTDWEVVYVNDTGMDDWFAEVFYGTEGILVELSELAKMNGVIRADLFRYLVLLLNGGVYTDTDTACLRAIESWAPRPEFRVVSPLAAALPHLYHLATSFHDDDDEGSMPDTKMEWEGDNEEPSLIVAIERDALASGVDWRAETFARGIQITQWTILAKPYHPVLLDVIGRALRESRKLRIAKATGRTTDVPDILDWTGPGAFDALFRYLLVKHGVHPGDISGITRPVRYGDVIIMPEYSFRADASEGWQGEDKVVWHGFFGRWKKEEVKVQIE